MPDQPGATPADLDTSATEDEDTEAQDLLADAVEGGDADPDPDGADKLGDPGKKALETMKERRRKATEERDAERAKREQYESLFRGLGVDPESFLQKASEGPSEDVESVRREAMSKANQRILRSEVKAAAAGKLADPTDALRLLELDKFEVNDDGEVDTDEIGDAISDLIKNKPYLAAQGGTTQFDSARGKRQPAGQLTQADIQNMSTEEINAARKAGRLDDLLGRKK